MVTKSDYEFAAKWLEYCPKTGNFYRKQRPETHFNNGAGFHSHNKGVGKIANRTQPQHKNGGKKYQKIPFVIDGEVCELKAHRMAWLCHYGSLPKAGIDHIDGNGENNKIVNLREVAHCENMKNKALYKRNKTGVPGVYREKTYKSYTVSINGKRVGRLRDFFEAVCLRKSLEVKSGYHENHGRSA